MTLKGCSVPKELYPGAGPGVHTSSVSEELDPVQSQGRRAGGCVGSHTSVNPSTPRAHRVLGPRRTVLGSVHEEERDGVDSPADLKLLGMESSETKLQGAADCHGDCPWGWSDRQDQDRNPS